MNDIIKECAVCCKSQRDLEVEIWTYGDKALQIPRSSTPYVDDPRSPDEKIICEQCYQKSLLDTYESEDQMEIHMEFGFEYIRANQLLEAKAAFTKSVDIRITADNLSHLAYCLNALGDKNNAKRLYLLALDIDAEHFIARANLENLEKERSEK